MIEYHLCNAYRNLDVRSHDGLAAAVAVGAEHKVYLRLTPGVLWVERDGVAFRRPQQRGAARVCE